MNDIFWWLWGIDAFIALIVLFFFLSGLMDGTVSSFNIGTWTILLFIALGIPLGSLWLRSHEYLKAAKILLGIIAVPGLIYFAFLLIIIITKPRWN